MKRNSKYLHRISSKFKMSPLITAKKKFHQNIHLQSDVLHIKTE